MTTQTSTQIPTPARTRASNAEREATVARLHHAVGEGRLDLGEVEQRVAAAYAAQYRDELPPLVADLPDGAPEAATTAPTWAQLWVAAVWRARATLLGAADRPTAGQCRAAALVAGLAVLWTVVCAFLGAGLVG